MGRVKLQIKKLENINGRQATYAKRKSGIMKKARELSILCDIDVVLLMFSPTGKPSLCIGKNSIGEVITKFAQFSPQEIAKRKMEGLEVLKKTFMKLNHDVNICQFMDESKSTIEVLNEKVRFLRAQLSKLHTRLSYWTELEKIENVEDLQKLENSLIQSLDQMRFHKENMQQRHHQQQHQQQQLMSLECKNQMKNGIDVDLGMDIEKQLENFSWIRTDENMNNTTQYEDPNLQFHQSYLDIMCSTSSQLGNYSGFFGKTSDISAPYLATGCIPGTSTDPSLQFSNSSYQNDPKLQQQLPGWNQVGIPADYYVNQMLEGSSKPQNGGNWASSETLPYHVSVFDDPMLSQQPN